MKPDEIDTCGGLMGPTKEHSTPELISKLDEKKKAEGWVEAG